MALALHCAVCISTLVYFDTVNFEHFNKLFLLLWMLQKWTKLFTNVVGRYRDNTYLVAGCRFDFPWMKPAILSRRAREEQQIWLTTAAWLPRPLTPVAEWTMLLKMLYSEHDR